MLTDMHSMQWSTYRPLPKIALFRGIDFQIGHRVRGISAMCIQNTRLCKWWVRPHCSASTFHQRVKNLDFLIYASMPLLFMSTLLFHYLIWTSNNILELAWNRSYWPFLNVWIPVTFKQHGNWQIRVSVVTNQMANHGLVRISQLTLNCEMHPQFPFPGHSNIGNANFDFTIWRCHWWVLLIQVSHPIKTYDRANLTQFNRMRVKQILIVEIDAEFIKAVCLISEVSEALKNHYYMHNLL